MPRPLASRTPHPESSHPLASTNIWLVVLPFESVEFSHFIVFRLVSSVRHLSQALNVFPCSIFYGSIYVYACVSMHWQTNTDTGTDTHIRIYALWLLYFQFASTNREQLWNAFKWRPKNILSLFAYCALIAPKIEYNFNSSVDQA